MKKVFILCLTLSILVLAGCGNTQTAEQPTPAKPVEQQTPAEPTEIPETHAPALEETSEPASVETEEPFETYIIDFAGLQLKYPVKWKEKVTVSVTENKAAFACGDVPLFDILANIDEGYILGTVCSDEYTVLSIIPYDIKNTDDIDLYTIKEDVNVIVENLVKDYDFIEGIDIKKEDTSTFSIETFISTMEYPAKWEGIVSVNVSEEKASFSNNGIPLFDLVFAECEGSFVGNYGNTPIYIVEYPVSTDEQIAMQMDFNVILQHLMEDPKFSN